ncbi:MAG: hypothetical protein PHW50_02455 [Patescibacteria group bacterium]|nr:hypothetical protein [Patescibacteria group bacterium]
MDDKEKLKKLWQKVQEVKKDNKLDLSSDEDLSIAIMNLVSIEEHFFFTSQKNSDNKHLELLKKVREMRKNLLARIVKNPEGEEWCISKHLLAASMRLMEVGTKKLNNGEKKEAQDLFTKAYDLYSIFWGINLKLIPTQGIKTINDKSLDKQDKEKSGFLGSLKSIINKLVDCCRE